MSPVTFNPLSMRGGLSLTRRSLPRRLASHSPRSLQSGADRSEPPRQIDPTGKHFRFTEYGVKPKIYENQKYFAFPEV
jgi:hypothetical protein